jgi:uncharacterized protein YgiM (DUF1202 family)
MKKILVFLIFAWVAAALGAQSMGGTMYVAVKAAALRTSPRFFSDARGTVPKGAAVTVLRSGDNWVEVASGEDKALRGWLPASALSSRRVGSAVRAANAEEVAMAGKGFSAEVEEIYKSSLDADYSAVDAMEELTVSGGELYSFMSGGRLETGD